MIPDYISVQTRAVVGARDMHAPPPPLGEPSFWYSLLLVMNGMTLECQKRKLSNKFRIKSLGVGKFPPGAPPPFWKISWYAPVSVIVSLMSFS